MPNNFRIGWYLKRKCENTIWLFVSTYKINESKIVGVEWALNNFEQTEHDINTSD